jgi:NAD-reducing hydrogenase small subunit
VLQRGYLELADATGTLPKAPGIVPELLERVLPLHEVIAVDVWLPGCPPSATRIREAIAPLLQGDGSPSVVQDRAEPTPPQPPRFG